MFAIIEKNEVYSHRTKSKTCVVVLNVYRDSYEPTIYYQNIGRNANKTIKKLKQSVFTKIYEYENGLYKTCEQCGKTKNAYSLFKKPTDSICLNCYRKNRVSKPESTMRLKYFRDLLNSSKTLEQEVLEEIAVPIEHKALKRCFGCGRVLPKREQYFFRQKNSEDGFFDMCKTCYQFKELRDHYWAKRVAYAELKQKHKC